MLFRKGLWPALILAVLVTGLVGGHAEAGSEKGYLGVALERPDADSGAMIGQVFEDSPAEEAGLEEGDVVLEFDGNEVENTADLVDAVRGSVPGESVELVVLRDGKKKSIEVEMGERERRQIIVDIDKNFRGPHGRSHHSGDIDVQVFSDGGEKNIWVSDGSDLNSDRGFMGVHLDDLTEQLGEYFGVKGGEGALVTEVTEDSPAEKAGLAAGDIIVKIDDEDIESSKSIHKTLAGSEPGQTVRVSALRKGKSKNFDVTLTEVPEDALAKRVMKRIEILGDADDIDVRSDRHFMFRGNGGSHGLFQSDDDSGANVEIIHLGDDEGVLDELRDELDQLREELEELREEVKK